MIENHNSSNHSSSDHSSLNHSGSMVSDVYDVIIVGAGIAGCEAAWHCGTHGYRTLLVTTSLDTVYTLLGEGVRVLPPAGTLMHQVVAAWLMVEHRQYSNSKDEDVNHIDINSVVDGEHAKVVHLEPDHVTSLADGWADESFALPQWVPNWEYHRLAKAFIEKQPAIHLLQSSVIGLVVDKINQDTEKQEVTNRETGSKPTVTGVATWEGIERYARRTALCVGSFLQARLYLGALTETAGRLSEMAYDDLYNALVAEGISFVPGQLAVTADPKHASTTATPSYHVNFQIVEPALQRHYALTTHSRLYAAGVCTQGFLQYEAAANEGRNLGKVLVASLEREAQ